MAKTSSESDTKRTAAKKAAPKPVAKKVEEPLSTVPREVTEVEKLNDRQRASFERFKEEEEERRRASLGKD